LCQIEIWSLADATLFDKLDCHDFASGIALSHQTQQLAWVESGNAPRVIARNLAQRSTSWLAKLPFDLSDNVGRKIAFSADDKLLAVGGKRSVMVFDALNGTQKLYVADVGADVVNLSINGDGTRLAVASGDGAIRVLDGESGTLLQLIPSAGLGGVAFIEGTPWLVAAFGGDNINNPRISQWYVDLDKLAKEVAERIAHLRPVVK
jgi:WD40 repeat protein